MISLDHVLELVDTVDPSKLLLKGFLGPVAPTSNEQARSLLLEHKHSLVINGAHALDERVAAICRELEDDPCLLVRSNIYWTWPGTWAYPLHWDTHDLVAHQIHGQKRWTLYEPVHEAPIRGQTLRSLGCAPPAEVREVVTMEPGSRLFVERGVGHEVLTVGDEPSVHITFGFHRPTRRDLLKLAMEEALLAAEADVAWRSTELCDLPDATSILAEALERQMEHYRTLERPHHIVRDPLRGTMEVREGHPNQDSTPRETRPLTAP